MRYLYKTHLGKKHHNTEGATMNKTAALSFIFVILVSLGMALFQNVQASEGSWTTKASMPQQLGTLQSAVVNDRIYLITTIYNFQYDPASDTWSKKQGLPTYRGDAPAVATYQNKIYVIGGRSNGTSGANEVYDPATDTWAIKASMPTKRQGLEANCVNGKIYLISGLVANNPDPYVYSFNVSTVNEQYDPATDTWAQKMPIPNGVSYYASTVVNNKIYVISANLTQIYDPQTDSWSYGAAPLYSVGFAACSATTGAAAPQKIYVMGGKGNYKNWTSYGWNVNYNQVYDPQSNSWTLDPPVPTARSFAASGVVNEKIYLIGGMRDIVTANDVGFNVTEEFDPLAESTSALTVGLSESASAINYGNAVNFTVTADGGTKPYTYAWYLDNQRVQTINSPYYYLMNASVVGSHHVYVQVTDFANNSAQTLTVEFNVLPVSSPSTSLTPSQSPSIPESPSFPFLATIGIVILVAAVLLLAVIFYRKKGKSNRT